MITKKDFIHDDEVYKPMAKVYGPCAWYGSRGNLDDSHPSARRFKERMQEEEEERNRQKHVLHEGLEQDLESASCGLHL